MCRELQSLRSQVPESFEFALRDDSEVDSFPMPMHLPPTSDFDPMNPMDERSSSTKPRTPASREAAQAQESNGPGQVDPMDPMDPNPSIRRSSVHSTESRASRSSFKRRNSRNTTFDVESDPVTHSYSINGITRKEPCPAFHRVKQQHEDNNPSKYSAGSAWFGAAMTFCEGTVIPK